MIARIDARKKTLTRFELQKLVPRASLDVEAAVEVVRPLVQQVRAEGEAALRAQAERFDGVTGHKIRVPHAQIKMAYEQLATPLKNALSEMIRRVRLASAASVPPPAQTEIAPGALVEQRWVPVERVGLYVPGGKAVYPSSVVMNAVAAQEAGVTQLALASPVQKEYGSVHPTILAAAHMLGIDEVYAMGGAGAIAAFAYGVEECGLEPVDIVTGPGNIFVAAAKRIVNGTVGIDSEAGTTEILILADETADPALVAADLLSQAEHDEAAASVLVTDSRPLADTVVQKLEELLSRTANAERARQALSGPQSAIILVKNREDALALANAYAPEHLEIHTRNLKEDIAAIRNAGAIFAGPYAPVSLGDYLAGSNHVLPTGGTSRFQSGLGSYTFLRAQQVVTYSQTALENVVSHLGILAREEHLPAHAEAAEARIPCANREGISREETRP